MGGPVGQYVRDLHRQIVPIYARVGVFEVEMPGNQDVPHRQNRFDQAGDACGGPQVPDIGLHRTDQHRASRLAAFAVDLGGGRHLDGVAHDCAGTVSLQVVDFPGSRAGTGKGLFHRPLLGDRTGHGQPLAGTVLVDRRSANYGPDGIAVGFRLAEELENYQAAALAGDKTVGGRVKGPALARRRQHSRVGAQVHVAARKMYVYTAGNDQVCLAALQRPDPLLYGNQGRRAGRVNSERRAFQSEGIGHSSYGSVQGRAGNSVQPGGDLGGLGSVNCGFPVVVDTDARIDAGAAVPQTLRVYPGVLQGVPTRFQHQALLRVEELCLYGRYAEKPGVELVNVLEMCAETHGFVCHTGIGLELACAAKDGAGRPLDYGILPRDQLPPKTRKAIAQG